MYSFILNSGIILLNFAVEKLWFFSSSILWLGKGDIRFFQPSFSSPHFLFFLSPFTWSTCPFYSFTVQFIHPFFSLIFFTVQLVHPSFPFTFFTARLIHPAAPRLFFSKRSDDWPRRFFSTFSCLFTPPSVSFQHSDDPPHIFFFQRLVLFSHLNFVFSKRAVDFASFGLFNSPSSRA